MELALGELTRTTHKILFSFHFGEHNQLWKLSSFKRSPPIISNEFIHFIVTAHSS